MAEVMMDARMIRHSGIGTYLRGLLGAYQGHSFFRKHSLGLALSPKLFSEVNGCAQPFPFLSPIYSIQEQMEYPFRLGGCRLWHAPHYNVPLLKGRTKLVVTIHDLIHWVFRGKFYSPLQGAYANYLIRQAIRLAGRIITVSNNTANDLVKYFGVSRNKVRVVYEGVAPQFFSPPEESERKKVLVRYALPESLFLYVGLIKPHKNVKRLVEVFKRLWREKKIKSALVVVGKKDKNYPAGYEALRQLSTGEGIHYIPAIESESELSALYASATALVHPSLYEGFGLTVLEAMASGTPVIASRVASLPEILGESAYYIDPHSNDSLGEALELLESDEGLRKRLAEKGKKQAGKFSWKQAAEETIRVYEEVLEER